MIGFDDDNSFCLQKQQLGKKNKSCVIQKTSSHSAQQILVQPISFAPPSVQSGSLEKHKHIPVNVSTRAFSHISFIVRHEDYNFTARKRLQGVLIEFGVICDTFCVSTRRALVISPSREGVIVPVKSWFLRPFANVEVTNSSDVVVVASFVVKHVG